MMLKSFFPKKVFIEEAVLELPFTKRILENLPRIPNEIVSDPHNLLQRYRDTGDIIGEGKKYLLIAKQKGGFIKPCPCTPCYLGCNYFIVNLILNCPLDCSYCILQDYLSNPFLTVFANLEDLWKELDIFFEHKRGKYLRIGTGELGDSLVLDHITEHSKDLISYFRGKKNAIFELKTKSVEIANILNQEQAKNIVISWSLNSLKIAQQEEKGAPPVEERIKAAKTVSDKGYDLGFHFDPLIRYPGWEEGYAHVIKLLLNTVDPTKISWISLGTLRFPPKLKPSIQSRFPKTKIVYEEFITGNDGKLRYFKPLRLEIFQKVANTIRSSGGKNIPLYLCMESEEIWEKTLNWRPESKEDVEASIKTRRP